MDIPYYYPTMLSITCPRRLYKTIGHEPIDYIHKLTAEGKKAHKQIMTLIKENIAVKLFIETLGGLLDNTHIEQKDEIELDGYKLRFRPDLHFPAKDRYVIIDFKNRYRTDIYDSDRFQLEAYAYSIMQEDITIPRTLIYLYAIQSNKYRQAGTVYQEDLEGIKDNLLRGIMQVNETLERPDHHTETGKDCEWCKWILECPAYSYQAKNQDAKELSKELIGIEKRRQALIYAIKAHMKGNDLTNIDTDIGQVKYEPTTRTNYDTLPILYHVLDMFQDQPKQLEKYINFSVKELKKLAEKNEELANFIYEEAGYPRFTTKGKEG